MDTRIAIHALSCSVDITWCASCGIVIRVTYRDTLVTITWYVSRYVSRYLGRDTIRVSSAQVSRCIDASMYRYDPSRYAPLWTRALSSESLAFYRWAATLHFEPMLSRVRVWHSTAEPLGSTLRPCLNLLCFQADVTKAVHYDVLDRIWWIEEGMFGEKLITVLSLVTVWSQNGCADFTNIYNIPKMANIKTYYSNPAYVTMVSRNSALIIIRRCAKMLMYLLFDHTTCPRYKELHYSMDSVMTW